MTAANASPQMLEQATVVGDNGESIGKVGQVYMSDDTGQPSWVTVKTGWFGTSESFVPLQDAMVEGDTIRVPYDKNMIKGAPQNEAGVPLSEADEHELHIYYGHDSAAAQPGWAGQPPAAGNPEQAGDPAASMTRSEEQLHVGTERVETGRARLRKYVVTEDQTVTVPVSHEEVRVIREPLQPGDTGTDVADIGDDSADVVLTEERVVVNKETVPVERVGLGTETVTEQQQVTESVRKEQVEFDDPQQATDSANQVADEPDRPRV